MLRCDIQVCKVVKSRYKSASTERRAFVKCVTGSKQMELKVNLHDCNPSTKFEVAYS